jgi:hypothetical protein
LFCLEKTVALGAISLFQLKKIEVFSKVSIVRSEEKEKTNKLLSYYKHFLVFSKLARNIEEQSKSCGS